MRLRVGIPRIDHFMICSISTTATVNEVTTSILRVNTVEPGQYGDYVCKASNKIGVAEARVNLFGEWKFRRRGVRACVPFLIFHFFPFLSQFSAGNFSLQFRFVCRIVDLCLSMASQWRSLIYFSCVSFMICLRQKVGFFFVIISTIFSSNYDHICVNWQLCRRFVFLSNFGRAKVSKY